MKCPIGKEFLNQEFPKLGTRRVRIPGKARLLRARTLGAVVRVVRVLSLNLHQGRYGAEG